MSKPTAFSRIETRLIWLMVLRVLVVAILLGLAVATEVIARPETPVHPLYFLTTLTHLLLHSPLRVGLALYRGVSPPRGCPGRC